MTPKEIDIYLKGPQRQLWKEALFVKYVKNKDFKLLLDPIPIKYLPNGTKALYSLIDTSIQEGNCSDACKFVAHHCVIILKVLILISPTVPCHMLNPSESTWTLQL